MWKPELGKNHVESTNSETEHYDEKEYNEKLAGSNLEVSFVKRRL